MPASEHMAQHLDRLAVEMLRDYDRHTPGTAFESGLSLTVGQAYQLQDRVASLRRARGERVAGYKIGCVAQVNQTRHGLTHPVRGHLWSTEQHDSSVTLDLSDFDNLALEAELAVRLRDDLSPGDASSAAIVDAVGEVVVVLELHHLALRGNAPTGPELIANNAIHAGVVRSAAAEAPDPGTRVDLSLEVDGVVLDSWEDRRWPDDVLGAVPWLVSELARDGRRLLAGELVLVGAWGPPRPLRDHASGRGTRSRLIARSRVLGSAEATVVPVGPAQ